MLFFFIFICHLLYDEDMINFVSIVDIQSTRVNIIIYYIITLGNIIIDFFGVYYIFFFTEDFIFFFTEDFIFFTEEKEEMCVI